MQKLGLPFPEEIDDLKDYLVYHHNEYMILETFDNSSIPEISLEYLKKVNKKNDLTRRRKLVDSINSGIFKGDVYHNA